MRNGSTVQVTASFRLVVALALALLGFASSYVFVSGSRAAGVTTTVAGATTTIPKPDPPPTTTVQRTVAPPAPPPPQPQPQPVVPQPPPSPTPPPPPPASPPPPAPTPPAIIAQPRAHVRHVGKPITRRSKPVHVPVHFKPARLPNPQRDAAAASAVTPPPASSLPSTAILMLLAIAIAFSLIAVTAALMPAWALPQSVLSVLENRRGDIVLTGIVVLLSVGLGLLSVFALK